MLCVESESQSVAGSHKYVYSSFAVKCCTFSFCCIDANLSNTEMTARMFIRNVAFV
jgi:hypothetical protein